ncbi:MAG: DUF4173 domain-containing protein [Firmicutes bacterium]|nr:DUF4173 domain-containing protein [Bacillota bacterium]
MDNLNVPTSGNAVQPQLKKPEYLTYHSVMAWLAAVAGFLFVKWIMMSEIGAGATLFVILFTVMSVICAKKAGCTLNAGSVILIVSALAFAPVFTISANGLLKFLTIVLEILIFAYWYLITFGQCGGFLRAYTPTDILKSLLVPFGSFGNVFGAMTAPLKKSAAGKRALYIFLGCVAAVIPTALVLIMLLNADDAFSQFVVYLFSGIGESAVRNILILLISVPFTMYIFGMIYTACTNRCRGFMTDASVERFNCAVSIAPAPFLCALTAPLCIVYVLFFISQAGYYLDAFSGIITTGFSAAEYARQGFFELCRVSVINAAVIALSAVISKKQDGKTPVPVRIMCSILSLFTLMLIATALRKMVLYIQNYGLTLKRIYTSWFMLLLAVIFILIIIKQVTRRLPFVKIAAAAFAVMFALLVYSDVDALTARTNINMYKSGHLETLDISAMSELSDSAVPFVAELTKDEQLKTEAWTYCCDSRYVKYKYHDAGLSSFNFAKLRAVNALRDIGLEVNIRIRFWD